MKSGRGRYTGSSAETWVVRPSARMLARRASWSARAGIAPTKQAHAEVGASILQTPGGVQSELASINSDFVVFAAEIVGFLKAHGYPITVAARLQPLATFFENVWTPLLAEWQAFFDRNKGWWDNLWWNHAPEGEQYLAQLVQVRAKAKELGMNVLSPTPQTFAPSLFFDPQHNLIDSARDGAEKMAADLWKIVKFALYAAVAIAGGFALFALAKTVKRGHGNE